MDECKELQEILRTIGVLFRSFKKDIVNIDNNSINKYLVENYISLKKEFELLQKDVNDIGRMSKYRIYCKKDHDVALKIVDLIKKVLFLYDVTSDKKLVRYDPGDIKSEFSESDVGSDSDYWNEEMSSRH
jgi:hypothetical protein